ncbi:MAG TPA: serine--tRNA ligase [Polyangiaceae bacterium]|nr:serine--tRNA ligase [Polyangiaceae bacterium]
MLDPRFVAEHLDEVQARLAQRSGDFAAALVQVGVLAQERRRLITETEQLSARRNAANQEMAALAKGGDKEAFAARRDELKLLSEKVKGHEDLLKVLLARFEEQLLSLPNLPHPGAPVGKSEDDNRVVREWGKKPEFAFTPRAHDELCEGLLDFERASKLSGARFSVLWGQAAKLERVLIQFMLGVHTEQHGYTEVAVPYLVRAAALLGTGQLPKFEKDLFKTARGEEDPEPLYLVPTAEVPVTNLHADEILEPGSLPRAYTCFSPCFRSEAGSYGKDVRGLFRQHQFDKVEIVRFVEPSRGPEELELLLGHAEAILQQLGLHYRVVELCTGDLGFASQKTYDIEVWLPSQGRYREISSCSWFGDFQARRASIRHRPVAQGKPEFVHTLNGSGLAVGRTLIAVFEQYQNEDGSVTVPAALRPALGADVIRARG